jgi:hypothetical protein
MEVLLHSFTSLADDQLLATVHSLAADERRATARLIAALAEVERRRLFLAEGCASLFTYCTQVLHLSEDAAYNRMVGARAVLTFPVILVRLAAGDVTLTTVRRLVPVLTSENVEQLLAGARHKSKAEVELLVAGVRPRSDVAAVVRKLPAPPQPPASSTGSLWVDIAPDAFGRNAAAVTASGFVKPATPPASLAATAPGAPRQAVVAPLSVDRYKIQFTASRDTYDKLQRARDLLRHVIPDGDPAAVFDRALDALLADLSRKKLAATARPRRAAAPGGARHIPAAVRREVWKRDAARCAFVGTAGRCTERGFLELHHVQPFADGGQATLDNIQLRCRAHNAYESEQCFGTFVLRESGPRCGSFRNERSNRHERCQAASSTRHREGRGQHG